MLYSSNQYSAMSTPDSIRGGVSDPQLASSDTGLQFIQPNQIRSNAHLLQFVKENNATLNFPQKLMLLLCYVDNERDRGNHITCISWVRDGHAFIIKDRNELVDNLLPLFFREGKFSSFTRKLYRWGFRQICIPKGGNKKDRDLLFGHEHFQRDNKALMSEMRSVTAAGTRRAITAMANKKKARQKKEQQGESKKPLPAVVSAPPASVPTHVPVLETTTTNLDRVTATSDTNPQNLVKLHLERLLGSSAAKSVPIKAETSFHAPQSLQQNPRTQRTLDSLLKTRSIPTNKDTKQDNLVQAHLEHLLGGSHSVKAARTSPTMEIKQQDNLVQSHLERLLGGSHTTTAAKKNPRMEIKQQDNLVQSHLERLLGGSNATTASRTSPTMEMKQQGNLVQSHLERLFGGSHASTAARTSPARDSNQDNFVQSHLERLLGGSHATNTKPAATKAQTPFQTPSLEQNSAQNAYNAILKAKSHSLTPAPVQNHLLGLNDAASLQNHVNYLKAMSQSSSMAAVSSSAPAISLIQSQFSSDIGSRLHAFRQTNAPAKPVGCSSQRSTAPPLSQARSAASMSSLPNSYLELIQGSGNLVGKPASIPNRGGPMPNLIIPESSAAPRNVMDSSSSSNMVGGGPSIIHDAGIFATRRQW